MALLFTVSRSNWNWKCWFLRRGENRRTWRKIPRSKNENQQQTQPTFDVESGNRNQATLVGGLRGGQMLNHCAIPAPQLLINRDLPGLSLIFQVGG